VGDCVVVLNDTLLSTSHRAEDEEARIVAAGGWVSHDKRVFGILQPSRSLGDKDLKMRGIPPPPLNKREEKQLKRTGAKDERKPSGDASQVIVAVPAVSTATVPPEGGILLVGSDGLFDLLPHKSCMKLARGARQRGESAAKVAEALCRFARERKSRDDISAIVCFIEPAAAAVAVAASEVLTPIEKEDLVIAPKIVAVDPLPQTPEDKKKKKNKKKRDKKKAAEAVRASSVEQEGAVMVKSPAEAKAAMLVVSSALIFYVLVMILQ
jgi:serine/threonine protein phosphatase PrpC